MYIGENSQARNRYFHGLLDDIGIYNRVLTEDEISLAMGGSAKAVDSKGKLTTAWCNIKK